MQGYRILFCLVIFMVMPIGTQSSKCNDIPPYLEGTFSENATAGTVLFIFNMSMDGIDLALNPSDNYTELYIDGNNVSIVLESSFAINILNPRPREPEPDTDEMLACNHSNRGDALPPSPLQQQLNYELECEHTEGISTEISVYITVKAVNDYAPEFFCSPFSKSISELTPIGTTVFISQGLSYDPDVEGGISEYEIQETPYFTSDGRSSRGVIVVNGPLDYDFGRREHLVNITVVDSANAQEPSLTNTTYITFIIEDGDDQDPVFTHDRYELSLPEENPSLIGSFFEATPAIFAYDLDFGINATVEYTLENTTYFEINKTTGFISPSIILDRETQDVYNLALEAYQVDNPLSRRAYAELSVHVTDVNDHEPEMTQSTYDATVQEHLLNGTVVTQVSATDLDNGINADIAYNLEDCNSDAVRIDSTNGEIYIHNESLLDRELFENITCKVIAQETSTVEQWSSNRSELTVHLSDVNDNSPIFTQSGVYLFTIPTDVKEGLIVGQVEAADTDEGVNAEIAYSINPLFSDDEAQYFDINPSTGELFAKSNVTFSMAQTIEVAVEATDRPTIESQRRTSMANVALVVDDTITTDPGESTTELSPTTVNSITDDDHTASDSVETVTSDVTSSECVCIEPTTGVPVKEEEDDNSLVLLIVIALLSALILFLLLLLIFLVAHHRHRYNERVDKASSTQTETAVQGIHWNDTKSLLAHEQYLAHVMPEIFSHLDAETSTEIATQGAGCASVGTDAPSLISNRSMNATRNNNSVIDDQNSSIYHVPVDCVRHTRISVPKSVSDRKPRSVHDLVIEVECEIPRHQAETLGLQCETPEQRKDTQRNLSGDESDEHDYAYLNPVIGKQTRSQITQHKDITANELLRRKADARASEQTSTDTDNLANHVSNVVPRLDLSTVCTDDDKEQFSDCRAEETIEINIPCDSPRSSIESPLASPREENPVTGQTIFIEVTPASPEVPEISRDMPPLTCREDPKAEPGTSKDNLSIETLSDDDYIDMGKEVFTKPLYESGVSPNADDVISKNSHDPNAQITDDQPNAEIKSTSGISLLDDVIAEEERNSERNSSIPDDALTWFTFAGDDNDYSYDTVKRAKTTNTRNPNARASLASSKAEMQIYTDGTASDNKEHPSLTNTNVNNNQAAPDDRAPYSFVNKSKKTDRLNKVEPAVLAAKMERDPKGTIRSNVSTESTVKVINDLPEENKSNENSDLYRDHTFFTRGGPITFL